MCVVNALSLSHIMLNIIVLILHVFQFLDKLISWGFLNSILQILTFPDYIIISGTYIHVISI